MLKLQMTRKFFRLVVDNLSEFVGGCRKAIHNKKFTTYPGESLS
jgi:hypothetical protein